MRLQPNGSPAQYTITAYDDDHVRINGVTHAGNIIVMPDRLLPGWTDRRFASLTIEDMRVLATLDAEILLLGTGRTLRFPPPELLRPLIDVRKGLDVMDLHAACRAYNLLSGEGRRVAAALLFD